MREKLPKKCPRCSSDYWNKPRRKEIRKSLVEQIKELYLGQQLSIVKVAELMGMTPSYIHSIMVEHKIPRRSNLDWRKNKPTLLEKVEPKLDEVKRMYFDEKLSQRDIAKHFGVNQSTIWLLFKKAGLKCRGFREGAYLKAFKGGHLDHAGYRMVKAPPDYLKYAHKSGFIREHNLVWMQAHGPIPEGYVIHHLNGIRSDNRLSNLVALPARLHGKVRPSQLLIKELRRRIRELEQQLEAKEQRLL